MWQIPRSHGERWAVKPSKPSLPTPVGTQGLGPLTGHTHKENKPAFTAAQAEERGEDGAVGSDRVKPRLALTGRNVQTDTGQTRSGTLWLTE